MHTIFGVVSGNGL